MADTLARLLELTENPAWLEDPSPLTACLREALQALERLAHEPQPPAVLAALDNTRDTLVQMDLALHNLTSRAPVKSGADIQPYLDWPTALRNGARGTLIAMLAGLLWYVFHWSTGRC